MKTKEECKYQKKKHFRWANGRADRQRCQMLLHVAAVVPLLLLLLLLHRFHFVLPLWQQQMLLLQ